MIEKDVINGQRVKAGDELYRIADHSRLWVIADVAESDLPAIKIGTHATVTVRAYRGAAGRGRSDVHLPAPQNRNENGARAYRSAESRWTLKGGHVCRCRVPDRIDEQPTIAVPASAIIDSGARQVVLVVKGEGRFEPRPVKLGRRGDGYVEILEGVTKGEEVVTSATFLIDAESNLKAALQAFTQPDAPK